MSNKEQTSIEYLIKEFSEILGPIETKPMQDLLLMDAMKKAKAMHKEETCQFVSDYLDDAADYGMTAEEYYDQIYGGNNG
jgi:hypothetical protein